MSIHYLKKEQIIKRSLKEVFSFFQQPENLSKITPTNLGFTIISKSPIEMKKGCLIEYKISLLGLPVYWKTEITDYNPPYSFTDKQLKGPYALWVHTHHFKEIDEGTLMTDEVKYSIPMGFIGEIAHMIYVKKELEHIFEYRYKIIEEVFKKL